MYKINNCPFCGATGPGGVWSGGDAISEFAVFCNNCDASGPRVDTRQDAILAWNKVTAEPRPVDDTAFRQVVMDQMSALMEVTGSGDAFDLPSMIRAIVEARPSQGPRPMSEAPLVWDPPIYLVHKAPWADCYMVPEDGMVTRLGRWSEADKFWNVHNHGVEPIGWWPVPTTTAAQVAALQTTAAGGSGEGE